LDDGYEDHPPGSPSPQNEIEQVGAGAVLNSGPGDLGMHETGAGSADFLDLRLTSRSNGQAVGTEELGCGKRTRKPLIRPHLGYKSPTKPTSQADRPQEKENTNP
jgi:hypothetical protein